MNESKGVRRDLYVPAKGACSLCPNGATVCHSARQAVIDRALAAGRHLECEFFKAILRPALGGRAVADVGF